MFGNEYLEQDSFALAVAKKFENKFQVVHCTSPEQLMNAKGEIIILDVVKGAKNPVIITDVEQLKTRKLTSLHDFDVGFFLNLLRNAGMAKKIKIIGLPEKGNAEEIAKKVETWI